MKHINAFLKKGIIIFLNFCLIMSLFGPNFISVYGTNSPVESNVGKEYANIIKNKLSYLEYAELIDFNGDGNQELYLFYSNVQKKLIEEVWQIQQGKAVKIFSEEHYADGSRHNFTGDRSFYKGDGKVYLVREASYGAAGINTMFEHYYRLEALELKDNKFVEKINLLEKVIGYNWDHPQYPEMTVYQAEINENGKKEITPDAIIDEYEDYHDQKAKKILDKYKAKDFEKVIIASSFEEIEWKTNDYNELHGKLLSSSLIDGGHEGKLVTLSSNEKYEIKDVMMPIINSRSSFDISSPNIKTLMNSDFRYCLNNSLFGFDGNEYFKDKLIYDTVDSTEDYLMTIHKVDKKSLDNLMISYIGISLPFEEKDGRYIFETEPAVGDNWSGIGDILRFYEIGQNLYYMQFLTLEYYGYWEGNSTFDTAILEKSNMNGENYWKVLRYDVGIESLDKEILDKYKPKEWNESNLELDFNSSSFSDGKKNIQEAIQLKKDFNSVELYDLSIYSESIVEKNNIVAINGKENQIILDSNRFKDSISKINKEKNELINLFETEEIQLFRSINEVLRIDVLDLDYASPINIKFKNDFSKHIKSLDGININLGSTNIGMKLNKKNISEISDFTIRIEKLNDYSYNIELLDKDKNKLKNTNSSMVFFLPAQNNDSMVLINEKTIPSVFDKNNSRIKFQSNLSGEYKVISKEVNPNDILNLEDYKQDGIRRAVLSGFFNIDKNNNFNPNEYISYNEIENIFPKELIGNINNYISRNDFIVLCSKLLASNESYILAEDILTENFIDYKIIPNEDRLYIDFAIKADLIREGGVFSPLSYITRKDASDILYRFSEKYIEKTPYTLSFSTEETIPNKIDSSNLWIISTSIFIIGAMGIVVYIKRKK